MNRLTTGEMAGTALFALILALLAYRIIRGMPKMAGDITAFRKRTLVWTQVALVLTVLQAQLQGRRLALRHYPRPDRPVHRQHLAVRPPL